MKTSKRIWIIVWLVFAIQANSGQLVTPYILLTDRQLYLTGEKISFALMTSPQNPDENFSGETIVYVELIAADGRKIAGEKYLKSDRILWASFQVPEELISGNYYLRGYSRYLRNYGIESFAVAQLKLINPRSGSVLKADVPPPVSSATLEVERLAATGIDLIGLEKTTFQRRENVQFRLDSTGMQLLAIEDWFISAIPAGTTDTVLFRFSDGPADLQLKAPEITFEKENHSIVLKGRIEIAGNGERSGRVVAMSIIGEKDFSTTRTDRDGRFLFFLPMLEGKRDVYVVVDGRDQESVKLRIENDFDSRPAAYPALPFNVDDREREVLLQMWKNYEIARCYSAKNIRKESADSDSGTAKPFYHKPDKTLVIDRYVQLPTLGEYFNELPMDVKVRERQGLKYFRFVSTDGEMMVHEPLVLVDGLYSPEIEKVLAISPQKIAYIDIVNRSYIKGDRTYGGMIHVVSKNGDFGGMDLPPSGVFIRFGFPAKEGIKTEAQVLRDHWPDARNTLYWYSGTGSRYTHSFTTADTFGTYQIVLTGICKDGRKLIFRSLFQVVP